MDARAGGTPGAASALIKYLGSKRTLVPLILEAVNAAAPRRGTVVDLFSGTSRVGHALKRAGYRVFSVDHNAYAHALATCYVQADAEDVLDDTRRLVDEFNAIARGSGRAGYFTDVFCERSRFFQPKNGARIDAIREAIARKGLEPELEAVVLVSLMEAADRVDSTTGLQMAYLKRWAPRAYNDLELRVPEVLARAAGGRGRAFCADAVEMGGRLEADAAYIDPPYNQHSYLGNYHVWETLVRWDQPAHYGVACKRIDCRQRPSLFNSRARCKEAMRRMIESVRARTLVVSLSDEGFISPAEMEAMLGSRGRVRVIGREYPRYVGAKIGIYNPSGRRVGEVGRLRNREHLFIAGAGAGEPVPAAVLASA
jgi:adenine-specific DNA-methyltransferase